MKLNAALMLAAFIAASPLLAQTTAPGAQSKPPVHQPGTPAQPAQPASPPPSAVAPAQTDRKIEPAPVDPEKEKAIRHLMDVTETSKLGENLNAYITSQVRSVMSRVIQADGLPRFMDAFNQKFAASAPASAVTDAAVPIYARAFSMEDIQGLTQFYESPLGQRVIKALPQVSQESQRAGVDIEQKAAMKVLQAMADDYPELKKLLQQGPGSEAEPTPERAPAPAPTPQASPAPQAAPAPLQR
ncbi:MAG TPA: DUF2059 domain-containing protein [Candidatus Acidoferrales bacterium]|nr:DUF2059 domain-containing protein [Candidatus Acidoferrales bacterium]